MAGEIRFYQIVRSFTLSIHGLYAGHSLPFAEVAVFFPTESPEPRFVAIHADLVPPATNYSLVPRRET